MNDQVSVVWPVLLTPLTSTPSKFGLRCTKDFRLSAWHDEQSRVSKLRHIRTSVSKFCRASTSTVSTMQPAPAFSARRASASATSHLSVG
jgi:hypothetical protein